MYDDANVIINNSIDSILYAIIAKYPFLNIDLSNTNNIDIINTIKSEVRSDFAKNVLSTSVFTPFVAEPLNIGVLTAHHIITSMVTTLN